MMKRTLLTLSVLAVTTASHAVNIATWTFETSIPSGSGSTNGPYAAESGLGTARGSHASSSTGWSNPVGNGSNESWSSDNWSIGDYYQFQVSTLGYSGIQMGFDQAGSSTGPRDFKVQYSTDGVIFSDFLNYTVLQNTTSNGLWNPTFGYTAYRTTVNFGSLLNNQSDVFIRLTMRTSTSIAGSTVGTTGTSRVDNVVISGTPGAVPEPFTMGLGIAGAGMFVRRRLKAGRA